MSASPHLLALCLLLSQVMAEWVEIEQNHHKPLRKVTINKAFHGIRNADFEETTKDNRIYRNYSIEKQWGKGVINRVSDIGSIRRVHDPSVKTTGIIGKPEPGVFPKNDVAYGDRSNYHVSTVTPPSYIFDKTYKPKIKPNPVHLTDNKNDTSYNNMNAGSKHTPDDFESVRSSLNDSRRKISHDGDQVNIPNRKITNQMEIVIKKPFKHVDREISSNFNDEHTNFQRIHIGDGWTSKRPLLFSTTHVSLKEKIPLTNTKNINRVPSINEDVKQDTIYPNISLARPIYISALDSSKNYGIHNQPILYKTKAVSPGEKTELFEESIHKSDFEEISNSSKADAINGMWRLMKVVTDTIYRNTHRSFRSKVKYLERLRTTILTTIEDQIETVWRDDSDGVGSRRSRRAREARGHLEFPSSESALMSISFLTFAVFLIKLVLQVIHTYKSKTMMVTPTVVTAVGRAADMLRSSH